MKTSVDESNRLSKLANKKRGCPDCGGALRRGPEGGCAMNVRCANCGNEFNIGWNTEQVCGVDRLDRDDTSIYCHETLKFPAVGSRWSRLLHGIAVFFIETIPWKVLRAVGVGALIVWLLGLMIQHSQAEHDRRDRLRKYEEETLLTRAHDRGFSHGIAAALYATEIQGTTQVLRVEKLIQFMNTNQFKPNE